MKNFNHKSLFNFYSFNLFSILIIILLFNAPQTAWTNETVRVEVSPAEKIWLDKKHTVRVRVGDHPPWHINTPHPQGMVVDYLTIIEEQFGINFKFIPDNEPWIKGFNDIAGEHLLFDLYPTAKRTPERLEILAMSNNYLHSPWVVFTRNKTLDIYNLEDLDGKKVSVERGYVMQKTLEKNAPEIELVIRENTEDALLALSAQESDAYIGNLIVTSYLIQRSGITNIKIACPTPFGAHSQAMATRKEWAPLISLINKGLNNIPQKERTRIQNKYLAVRFEHGIRLMDVIKWILGITSVLLVILAIILLWNRRLNKEITERQKVEEKLLENENKYRSLSNAAFEGIVISNKGKIIETNTRMAKQFGYSKTELIGMKNIELVDSKMQKEVQNKLLSGYEKPYEILGLKKDGTIFPIEVQSKMFEYQEQQVRVSAVRDLTESKKMKEEIKTLSGLLPICSFCKKIRDDKGYWNQIETYISEKSDAEFSHGICQTCAKKHYPDMDIYED